MPKYRALRTTLLAHECRVVKEGEEFVTEFPAGMRLGDNLELVEEVKPQKGKASKPDESLT